MYRGVTDDGMNDFGGAGEKEALNHNWREIVGWTEAAKDPAHCRVLEVSTMDCS